MKENAMKVWMLVGLAVVSIGLASVSLHAAVPGRVDFQGLLLDGTGQPATGTVDLVFTLYDDPTAGTAVWTESLSAVPLVDGVYSVTLGATTPITPALLAPGGLHLEIEADGETLSPRRPLFAVPYAVRAESAADADQVQGVSGLFLTQILEHVSFDGGDPPNLDPSEGIADVDGDGLANFVDDDNDGDGLSDLTELAGSTGINLVTPVITLATPTELNVGTPTLVTVSGTGFEVGMTGSFDGAPVLLSGVTATSFEVTVTATAAGSVDLVITRSNGEQAFASLQGGALKRVIVAGPVQGDFGGLAGADALCSARATQLGLSGVSFLAWVGAGGVHPEDRFDLETGPYELLDETRLAEDWPDLTDGVLGAPIRVPGLSVWTNVSADGGSAGIPQNCQDWTSNQSSELGRIGNSAATSAAWSQAGILACDQLASIYCFEQ